MFFAGRSLPVLSALWLFLLASLPSSADDKLGDRRGVFRASFNHDASRVVVHTRGGTVSIWELATGNTVSGDLDEKPESDGFLVSADGKAVVVGFKDGHCRVFDATTAKAISPLLDFRLNAEFQMPGLFSPDGNTVLLFGDKEAAAFEVSTARKLATISLGEGVSEETTGSAIFAADGSQCFFINGLGVVTRYDTKTWKPIGAPMRHPNAEFAYDFGFNVSPNGKWLVTYDGPGENGPKGQLQVWDATTNKVIGKPLIAVNGMAGRFVGNNRLLALPGRGDATVHDLPSMKVAYTLRRHDDIDGPNAEISPDAKWILVWGRDHSLDLVDAATGKLTNTYSGTATVSKVIIAPDSSSCYVAFDNSAFLLQNHYDNYVVKFSFPEMKITETHRVLEYLLNTSLSPDGKRLMMQQGGTDHERLVFLDTTTLKPIE